jgi:hypothetical protein
VPTTATSPLSSEADEDEPELPPPQAAVITARRAARRHMRRARPINN